MTKIFISKKSGYRKIWEEHHQTEIPIDENGKSFEIHHIDGNKNNNSIENLACVQIQKHYDIHYEQGDWGACLRIAQRMNVSKETMKELNILQNKVRIENGTHPLLRKNRSEKNIKNLNERNKKRVQERRDQGLLLFQDKDFQNEMRKRAYANGKHPFENGLQKKLVSEGKHHLLGMISCVKKTGEDIRITKEQYHNQDKTLPKNEWEYVTNVSLEGKKRKSQNKETKT